MSESVDDIEIDEEGLGSVEAVEEVFAELEAESERHARTVEQYEETSPETGMDSNYGSYDRETGSIYLDGVELQGSDDKIEGIKEKFKEGFEGLADWSEGEWNGITYRTDYHIEGSTLRLDTYVIEVNEPGDLDSGIESDTGSEGGDEDEPIAASNILDTERSIEEGQELVHQEEQALVESVQEVTAWSSWLEDPGERIDARTETTEVAQTENPLIIERPIFAFDNLLNVEDGGTVPAERVGSADESTAEITDQPEQQPAERSETNEEISAELSLQTNHENAESTIESTTGSTGAGTKPETYKEIQIEDSHSSVDGAPQEMDNTRSPISLRRENGRHAKEPAPAEARAVEALTQEVLPAKSALELSRKPDTKIVETESARAETKNLIFETDSPIEQEDNAEFARTVQPITLTRNIKRGVKVSRTEDIHTTDFSLGNNPEPQEIAVELAETTETPEEVSAETAVIEINEITATEAIRIEPAHLENQEPTIQEAAESVQIEARTEQMEARETIQKTTSQVEKKITEVRREIRLVKAETKKIEQVARERTQAERIYEPIREIRRVIINGPRLETGGIILRRNRSVISTEERDRLENTNRIVEIPRYNSRRRTPTRSAAIRLAA